MRVRIAVAVVCALLAPSTSCVGVGGSPAVAVTGPARAATDGRGERCDRDAIARTIQHARLRAHLARIATARFELAGQRLDGDGRDADAAVAVLDERDDQIRIAMPGDGVQLLVWIDRADLSLVTLAAHRVSREPGERPPSDGLGMTVLPGHPVDAGAGARAGWVRVHGHGLFAFDGWIPDDTGELWEPEPVAPTPGGEIWVEAGSSIVDDPDGHGRVLASLRHSIKGRLLESNALGADKVELHDADAQLIGYAVRPPPTRRLGQSEPGMSMDMDDAAATRFRGCLYSEPGGAVVGVVDARLDAVEAAGDGWGLTPIATPWGDVVFAVRLGPPAIK